MVSLYALWVFLGVIAMMLAVLVFDRHLKQKKVVRIASNSTVKRAQVKSDIGPYWA